MNDMTITTAGAPISSPSGENPFAVAFLPAQPTLDALADLRRPLVWLDKRRRSQKPLFDPAQARELFELISTDERLYAAQRLFRDAETEPAIESWVHVALSVMLQSIPAAAGVNDAFRNGIVDSMYNDPQVWGAYQPGFSAPVIARAIRQLRREDHGVPSVARILEVCTLHRRLFKRFAADIDELVFLRYEAEDQQEAIGLVEAPAYDPEDDVPF
jgi:hypothetical protein